MCDVRAWQIQDAVQLLDADVLDSVVLKVYLY